MLARRLIVLTALLIAASAIPSFAQDWRSSSFKFPQPVQLVAEIPVVERRGDEGLPPPPPPRRGGIGIVGVLDRDVSGAIAAGTELGSITARSGERLACVVAESTKGAKAIIRVTLDAPLGMRGYRIQGNSIEFRAGFESRPRIHYEGNVPEACRQRPRELAEQSLDALIAKLEGPAGSMPLSQMFDRAEKGVAGTLPVALAFLGKTTTATITFPMPRPFGQ